MTEPDDIEDPDRALLRAADRPTPPGFDPQRTLRRARRAELLPIVTLVAAGVLALAAAIAGYWMFALALVAFVLPDRIEDWRARAADREALLGDEDFLERELANVEDRLDDTRVSALGWLWLAALLAYIAYGVPKFAVTGASASAALALRALLHLGVRGRRQLREFEELGGSDKGGWTYALIIRVILILLPLLVLAGFVYRGFRRLIGRPVVEKDDDA